MSTLANILQSPVVQHAVQPVIDRVLGRAAPVPQQAAPATPAQDPAPQQGAQPESDPLDLLSDPKAYAQALSQAGAPAPYVLSRVSELVKQQQDLATLRSTQLANKEKSYTQAGDILEGYLASPTPENWKTAYGALKDAEPEIHGILPPPDQLAAPTADQLAPVLGMTMAHARMVAQAKTVADTREAAANTEKAGAETAGDKIANEDKQFRLNLLKNAAAGQTPDFSTTVKGMSIFANHPQEAQDAVDAASTAYTAALKSGEPLKAATDANEAVKGIADRLRAVSPGVVAGEAGKAKATLAATAGLQKDIAASEASYRNSLEQGDTATAKYYESLTSAKKAQSTANTIQRVVDLAKNKGNAVAAQQLKAMVPELTNAAQDIKRMGGSQAADMSTELDKAIGEIKSSTGGVPLTDSTLNAIEPFAQVIANGAAAQHNANVQALKQAYPQKQFKTEELPHQSATGPNGHKIVSHDGEQTWQDAQTGAEVK